ncbi:hypothetical protein [Streptomyces sp. ODS05-4]|uniref:hypothetical protein n=1 Tax=Streptomyces sp. ODS05-4 TaxID=2944939 RepID=UPI002109C77C|nr:hypothetical protein [Streptomyces sp. ODS05-4]
MDEFLYATGTFPAVLFTAALVVVVGFWLLVLAGAADPEVFDADLDADALHLGGAPVAVSGSLFVALAWFLTVSGSVLATRTGWPAGTVHVLDVAVLLAALYGAWRLTRALVRPLARLLPGGPGPSRHDFTGLTCVVRTGRVDGGFGQAEVTARDGSTALVQVRQAPSAGPEEPLAHGSTGLLYAYDEAGEFFWVAPFDPALDPRRPQPPLG